MMKHNRRSVYIYLAAGCALVAAVIATAALIVAHRQNLFALETQKAVVAFETHDAYLDMIGQIKHTAFNQDAYDNIVRGWNPGWLDRQFREHLSITGIPNVALFGPGGVLRKLNSEDGRQAESLETARGLPALLAAVKNNRGRGEIAPLHGVIAIDGKIYFAVAAAVTPRNTLDAPIADELQYIAVFFKPAANDFFDLLRIGFEAEDIHIGFEKTPPVGLVNYPLKDAVGNPIAYVQWRPHQPGANFVIVLLPVLVVMFVGLATALAVAAERWQTTQSKLRDSEAAAAAALEETRIKTVFLGHVSHELRTPLNAIIGFSEMLRMQPFGPLGAEQYRDYVNDILNSSQELLSIVNDLLEMSNLKSADFRLETASYDAAPHLQEAVLEAREAAAARKIALGFEGGSGAYCVCEPKRLREAVSRLIGHALKVSGEGETVRVSWRRDGEDIVIAVQDMREEAAFEINADFERLFQGTNTHYVARKHGLRLGLAIAAGITKAMGGRIGITAAKGQGTEIAIRLPVATAPEQAQAA